MKKTQMTREAALELARQESAKLLAAIDAETVAFIAEQEAVVSTEKGKSHSYINEWGQEMQTHSGLWLAELE